MKDARNLLHPSIAALRRACRHCGAESSVFADARVGVTCCELAVADQIRWRTEELERLRAEAGRAKTDLSALETEVRNATAYKRPELEEKLDRARRGFDARLRLHYQPLADELKADIARYQALLEDAEPTTYSRPYAEG